MHYRENANPLEAVVTVHEIAAKLRKRASMFEAKELESWRTGDTHWATQLRWQANEARAIAERLENGLEL